MAPLVRRCWAPPRPYAGAHAARPFAAQGLGDRCLGDLATAPPGTRVLRVSARCQLRRRIDSCLPQATASLGALTDRTALGSAIGAPRRTYCQLASTPSRSRAHPIA